MKCPKCKEEIDEVIVNSRCYQRGQLKEGSNEIESYEDLDIEQTLSIQCSKCLKYITKSIKE